jgi:hypothetical protein
MQESRMMEIGSNTLGTEVLCETLAAPATLHEYETLHAVSMRVSCFPAQEIWFFLSLAKSLDAPMQRNSSPRRGELNPIQPIGKLATVSQRGGKTEDANKGVQSAKTGDGTFQPGSTMGVAEQVNLIYDHKIDLGNPRPVRAPAACAGIKPLGRHDQKISVRVGCGNGPALWPIVASENTHFVSGKLKRPASGKLLRQGTQRAEVNGAVACLESLANGHCGKPSLPASCGHLQDAAKAGIEQTMVDDFLLSGIKRCVHSCGWNNHKKYNTASFYFKTCGFE